MPFLAELLTSYVDEVFSYISVAFCSQIGKLDQSNDSNSRSNSVHSEIKEQYARVGGVAVEFCYHVKRTDILFDEIFSKFVDAQKRETFLDLLEPYILKDMLGFLPPEIMQELVDYYSNKGWLQRIEQCVLHMDISSLDFNQVVTLSREHGLYSAVVYVFNKGLDYFRAPLEELYAVLQNSQKETATALGYRMLVYLKYCFTGLPFPPEEATEKNDNATETLNALVQNTVDALVQIIDMNIVPTDTTSSSGNDGLKKEWPSKDIGYLFEFIAYYVALQRAKVCGLIRSVRHEYVAALDSYVKDVDEPVHAFSFINKALSQLTDNDHAAFRSAVILRIPELVELSRVRSIWFISHFSDESTRIITELHSHPRILFLYLKTLVDLHLFGTLDLSNLRKDDTMNPLNERKAKDHTQGVRDYLEHISNFPKYMRENPIQVPDDLIELYLELLCQYECGSVLKFLEMVDSYRVEHCLRLCQEYGIIDAAAFLLERAGDVGSALLLTLSDLNDKFVELHATVEAVVSNHRKVGSWHMEVFNTVLRTKEDKDTYKSSWKISKSHNGHILRKLLSQFIKEIVEGMIGFVHLPTIMSKLLSDNGSREFGDFKLTMLGMLGTYGFERILDAAKLLIEDDSFYTMSLLKKGASHGYAPRNLMCCICNCLLTENYVSSGIRIFNYGHAMHIQYEVFESEAASSKGSSSGCPFEILSSLQKNKRFMQIENLPPLKLAPPAVYHEKVSRVTDFLNGESSNNSSATEKQNRNKQNWELRVKFCFEIDIVISSSL
ncbi:hypothetical protein Fmac_010725 [Flemingia macrophylla]|uniref:Vacuolar protein sorting-associated protein 8 central domain-containing protein n=1 Tax=Flemingia macrophylla TaxID=520843 RepID=A0ABD1MKF8_9FABA